MIAPASALRMQFSRSGGPGGQNVNKVNSKAELWIEGVKKHYTGEIIVGQDLLEIR